MMKHVIHGYEPSAPFHFFEELCAIPRPSYHEAGVADYLEAFAKQHGLFCYRDATHNVLIKKPATKGREQEPPLLLQAHTDMVAEKNSDVIHDFYKEGVSLVQKENFLMAEGTTLGADDGYGVASILAVLAEAPSHPALECLFTCAEEVGMDGARAFDFTRITARRMLNLDAGAEREITIGCCGGLRTDALIPVQAESCCGNGIAIRIGGLAGGHSGEDIHRGRANALALMGALLNELNTHMTVRIATLQGGDKDNAIPRECESVIWVQDEKRAVTVLKNKAEALKNACASPDDKGLYIQVGHAPFTSLLAPADTGRVLCVLCSKTGVLELRASGDGIPQTSRNVASVRVLEQGARICVSTRSHDPAGISHWRHEFGARVSEVGGTCSDRGAYPGWESEADSALSRAWQQAYTRVTGKHAFTNVVHAGLECGLISSALEGLVAISVGCDIFDMHTPKERMDLDSFRRFYLTLLAFLKSA